jgi:hypothetical protein
MRKWGRGFLLERGMRQVVAAWELGRCKRFDDIESLPVWSKLAVLPTPILSRVRSDRAASDSARPTVCPYR